MLNVYTLSMRSQARGRGPPQPQVPGPSEEVGQVDWGSAGDGGRDHPEAVERG